VTTTGMSHRHELLMLETGYRRLRIAPMRRSAVINDPLRDHFASVSLSLPNDQTGILIGGSLIV
jgi:hypothetical protein